MRPWRMNTPEEMPTSLAWLTTDQDDECASYLLHFGDLMRKLPPKHLSNFKHDLNSLMYKTEKAGKQQVVQHEL